jgi:hypothetical protein
MSGLNGDKARFRITRMRKLHKRQRIKALVASLKSHTDKVPAVLAPARPATAPSNG